MPLIQMLCGHLHGVTASLITPIWRGGRAMEEGAEKNKIRYLCIVRSIRNKQSKAWNSRTMNWILLVDYFCLGSTKAHEWCEWLGIDPYSYSA